MPIAETILTAVAKAVVERAIRSAGVESRVRRALGREPEQLALKRALGTAFSQLEKAHPKWTASLFDLSFFEHEGADVITGFLTRTGRPDPSEMALAWARSLNLSASEDHTTLVRELEPVAADLLDDLARALEAEEALAELHDRRATERVAEATTALQEKLAGSSATPGTRWDYLFWLAGRTAYLDPRGIPQTQRQVQLRLDDVYVPLSALAEDSMPGAVDKPMTEAAASDWPDDDEVEDASDATDAEGLEDLAQRFSHLVILGDPGGGKTTLLRYLAQRSARRGIEVALASDGDAPRLPVLVRIAEYAEDEQWRRSPLSDFLPKYHRIHECPSTGLEDLLESNLEMGNCVVLLDGLDEVVQADDRRGVVSRIESFVQRYTEAGNRFVVTSRVAGYREAPLLAPFEHYRIRDMRPRQIERFLERWCTAVEEAQTPDLPPEQRQAAAQREIAAMMDGIRTTPGVRRLATNPLLLTILALIHRSGARLPDKRVELYKVAATALAKTWRSAQGVRASDLLNELHLDRILGRMAYWLHLERPTGIASTDDVQVVMGEERARIQGLAWDPDDPSPDIASEVNRFLEAVRIQTGLFVERGPGQYGFMHLTFEEYYSARNLVDRRRRAPGMIRRHLHDARWDEPILLGIGYVGLDSPQDASELIEGAVLAEGEIAQDDGFSPSRYEEFLARDLLFALRCLVDGIPVEGSVRSRIATRVVQEIVSEEGCARFVSVGTALDEALSSLAGSDTLVLVKDELSAALGSASGEEPRARGATLLLSIDESSEAALNCLLELVEAESARVRAWATRALVGGGKLVLSEAGLIRMEGLAPRSPYAALVLVAADRAGDPRLRASLVAAIVDGEDAEELFPLLSTVSVNESVGLVWLDYMQAGGEMSATIAATIDNAAQAHVAVARAVEAVQDDPMHSAALHSARLAAAPDLTSPPEVDRALEAVRRVRIRPEPGIRWTAARILGAFAEIRPEEVFQIALEFLDDAEEAVRQQAGSVMARANRDLAVSLPYFVRAGVSVDLFDLDDDSRQELQKALVEAPTPESPEARAVLAEGLTRMWSNGPPALDRLRELSTDSDPRVRAAVAGGRYYAISALSDVSLATMRDPDPTVRVAAARGWRYANPPEPLHSALRKLLDDDVEPSRFQSALTLAYASAEPPDDEVRRVLAELFGSTGDWVERKRAVEKLAEISQYDEETVEALWRGLRDPGSTVQEPCARALIELASRFPERAAAIEARLVAALTDASYAEREPGRNGTGQDYALEALRSLLASESLSRH